MASQISLVLEMHAKGIAVRSARNLPLMYPEWKRNTSITNKSFIHLLAGEGRNPFAQHRAGGISKLRYLDRERV